MKRLKDYAVIAEEALAAVIPEPKTGDIPPGGIPWLLADSMRYSLLAGGKRLRPAMLLAVCDMLDGDIDEALAPACALEMIHTYSLIHDDLPCMDDDTVRRGRPTNHVVYGEAQAMLAGDGLLTHAFELMAENAARYPWRALHHINAMHEIARGAGVRGMIAGQVIDLYSEREHVSDRETLDYIHSTKTSGLFIAAMRAGGALSGANQRQMDALTEYGEAFGLLFQAVDDILDASGDADSLGKSIGKDQAHGKLTCVSLMGLDGAREHAATLAGRAKRAMKSEGFGDGAGFFIDLASDMLGRDR